MRCFANATYYATFGKFIYYCISVLMMLSANDLSTSAITNCPMAPIRAIIERAREISGQDAALQMQIIRRILEDIYGGSWGVIIIKNAELVSSSVHWTIPDHKHRDGSPAFCLYVGGNWQYNVFKTGAIDSENRVAVDRLATSSRSAWNFLIVIKDLSCKVIF